MKSILFSLIVMTLVLVSCQPNLQPSNSDNLNTLFTVGNSINVSADEFVYMYEKNNFSNKQSHTKEDILSYLELYKVFKLKILEAQSLGMDTTKAFRQEFGKYREQLIDNYLSADQVTDSLIQEAYDRYKHEIKASHILKKVAPHQDTLKAYNKIIEARERILGGEDFNEVAKEISDDPSAKTNGGDLGYFTSMQMVYPFETAAYNTKVGDVSNPVKTQFGYHIIKVVDRRPAQGKIEVAHIMIRTSPNDDPEKKKAAQDKIFDIKEQLVKGMDWDMLCRQYSEDNNSKNKGGKLRPFGTGNMPPTFYEVSASLRENGEISDPFTSPYGWHIVKLIRKMEQESFDDMKGIISNRIKRDERVNIGQKALITKLKKENNYNEVDGAYLELVQSIDTTMFKPRNESSIAFTLFEIGDEKYTNLQYLEHLSVHKKPSNLSAKAHIKSTYDQFVEESLINYEKAHLADKYFDYKMLVNEYREGIMLFNLMDEKVWSKASEDTVGLNLFFENNRGQYRWKERLVGTIYSSSDKSIIQEIKQYFNNGDSLKLTKNNLETRYNQNSKLNLQVVSGPFEKGSNQLIDDVDWTTGIHEFSDSGMNFLVNIEKILPESDKEFDQIKGLVISDYQGYLEKQWVKSLKDKYPISVNNKLLSSTLNQLEKK